jgi:hypothetical protein
LFGVFDTQSAGRISQSDFTRIILESKPVSGIVERLKFKLKKGGDRFLSVITEEFQNADIPFGSEGMLPLSNFQTIMQDYEMSLLESDMIEMRKKAIIQKDRDGNDLVRYKELMTEAKPRRIVSNSVEDLDRIVIKIQKLCRGY